MKTIFGLLILASGLLGQDTDMFWLHKNAHIHALNPAPLPCYSFKFFKDGRKPQTITVECPKPKAELHFTDADRKMLVEVHAILKALTDARSQLVQATYLSFSVPDDLSEKIRATTGSGRVHPVTPVNAGQKNCKPIPGVDSVCIGGENVIAPLPDCWPCPKGKLTK